MLMMKFQSLDEAGLAFLGRRHEVGQARRAVAAGTSSSHRRWLPLAAAATIVLGAVVAFRILPLQQEAAQEAGPAAVAMRSDDAPEAAPAAPGGRLEEKAVAPATLAEPAAPAAAPPRRPAQRSAPRPAPPPAPADEPAPAGARPPTEPGRCTRRAGGAASPRRTPRPPSRRPFRPPR